LEIYAKTKGKVDVHVTTFVAKIYVKTRGVGQQFISTVEGFDIST
jgi:hypothetical protein